MSQMDIQAATAGSIANAHDWTLTDNNIRTADGSKPVFTESPKQDGKDVPFGEPK